MLNTVAALRALSILPVLSLLCALPNPVQAGPADTTWIKLFNGKDFTGWNMKTMGQPFLADPSKDAKQTYRITADSAIEVNYSNYANWNNEPWSHVGYNQPFSYYVVRLEYQFYGTQVSGAPGYANDNSGIMLHSQDLSKMSLNQNWPISLEHQLLGPKSDQGGGVGKGNGNLCTPGTAVDYPKGQFNDNHCINAVTSPRAGAPTWGKAGAIVYGDSMIIHTIENKPVLTYYKPVEQNGIVTGNATHPITDHTPLKTGYILLQAESTPIRFRNIYLANLEGCMDKNSPNYKSYVIKSKPSECTAVPNRAWQPDPANQGLTFEAAAKRLTLAVPGEHSATISDVSGRKLWSQKGKGTESYDLGALKFSGVCLLTVNHAGGAFTQKLYLDR